APSCRKSALGLAERSTVWPASRFTASLKRCLAGEPLLNFNNPAPGRLGRLSLPLARRQSERLLQANLRMVQGERMPPALLHHGRFRLRLGELIASVCDRPLGQSHHLVEPQSAELGAHLPPFKGDIPGKEFEQCVAQARKRWCAQSKLGHLLA